MDFDIDFLRVALESAADHLEASRPERENAKVGELVQRLLFAGDLHIQLAYEPDNNWAERYRVESDDGQGVCIVFWGDSLLSVLERVDDNWNLLSHT